MARFIALIQFSCAVSLLLLAGCKLHFADSAHFGNAESRSAFGASLAYSSEDSIALRYLPRQERWDQKIIGTVALESKGIASTAAPLEIRRIRRGYALEQELHSNEISQRWTLSTSYGREHDAMMGVCMRWNF